MTEMAFSFLGSPFCSSPSFLVLYLSESEVEMSERKIRNQTLESRNQESQWSVWLLIKWKKKKLTNLRKNLMKVKKM